MGLLAVGGELTVASAVASPFSDPVPASVDRALGALDPGTVVFNTYLYGGWMAWKHPELVHGIDGLAEAYRPDYIRDYLRAESLRPGWEGFLGEVVGADVAFLPARSALAAELAEDRGWTVLAETEEYVVLDRPD